MKGGCAHSSRHEGVSDGLYIYRNQAPLELNSDASLITIADDSHQPQSVPSSLVKHRHENQELLGEQLIGR